MSDDEPNETQQPRGSRAMKIPEPPPHVIEAAMQALCRELMDQYPGIEAVPVKRGQRLRPGAIRIRGARPLDDEAGPTRAPEN